MAQLDVAFNGALPASPPETQFSGPGKGSVDVGPALPCAVRRNGPENEADAAKSALWKHYGSTAVMFRFGTSPTGMRVTSFMDLISTTETKFEAAHAT
jgi:hypothetical protein